MEVLKKSLREGAKNMTTGRLVYWDCDRQLGKKTPEFIKESAPSAKCAEKSRIKRKETEKDTKNYKRW